MRHDTNPPSIANVAHHSRRIQKKHYKKLLAGELEGGPSLRLWIEWCLWKTMEFSRLGNRKIRRPEPNVRGDSQ